jgi:hypothetical protein
MNFPDNSREKPIYAADSPVRYRKFEGNGLEIGTETV